MKQTNNAIKFLMAQYRAIFKNANIAMLAAIAASALAAGQAQAAGPIKDWTALNGKTTITDTDTLLVSGDSAIVNNKGFNVTISSGDAHVIKGNTAHGVFTVAEDKEGSLTINASAGDAAGTKLVVGSATAVNTAEVTITNLTNTKGTLEIEGNAADAGKFSSLNATTINIGVDSANANEAIVSVKGHGSLNASGTLEIGKGGKVTVAENGAITAGILNMSSGSLTTSGKVEGTTINVSGGTVEFAAATGVLGSDTSAVTISGGTVTATKAGAIKGSSVDIQSGTFTLTEGLTVGSAKGTVDITGGKITVADTKTLTLVGTSNLKSGSDITTTTGGKLAFKGNGTIADDAKLTLGNTSETNIVADATTTHSQLNVSKTVFGTLTKEAGNKVVASGAAATQVSELHFTDDSVDLSSAGVGILADGGTLVAAKVANSGTGVFAVSATNIDFKKAKVNQGTFRIAGDNVTVGTGGKFSVEGGAELEVGKTLTIDGGNTELKVVSGGLILNGTPSETLAPETLLFSGAAADDAKLKVKKGDWTVKNVTLNSGAASIESGASLTVAGVLTSSGDSLLTISSGGTLSTVGSGSLAYDKANADKLVVAAGGTLKLGADDILKSNELDEKKVKAGAISGAGVIVIGDKTTAALSKDEFEAFKNKFGNFSGVYKMNVDVGTLPQKLQPKDVLTQLDTEAYNASTLYAPATGLSGNYSVGNVQVEADSELKLTTAKGALTLHNASEDKGNGNFVSMQSGSGTVVAGVNFGDAANSLTLINKGDIGAITVATGGAKGIVNVGYGDNAGNVTVKGTQAAPAGIGTSATDAVKELNLAKGSSLVVEHGDVFANNFNMLEGSSAKVNGDITTSALQVLGNSLTANKLTISDASAAAKNGIAGGANVNLTELSLGKNNALLVGEAGDGTPENLGSSAKVHTDSLKMNATGSSIFVDPNYGTGASLFATETITDAAGTAGNNVSGKVAIGSNSAFGIGFASMAEFEETLSPYLTNNGGFDGEGAVKNALVLNKPVTIANDKGITVDSELKATELDTKVSGNTLTLGAGAALIVTQGALAPDGAVKFANGSGNVTAAADKSSLVIFAADITQKDTGKQIFGAGTNVDRNLVGQAAGGLLNVAFNTNGTITLTNNDKRLDEMRQHISEPTTQLFADYRDGKFAGAVGSLGYKFVYESLTAPGDAYKAVDIAAHAATYAGAQQAAVAAVTTMADAMFGRVGAVGVEAATIAATGSQANGGVWLTPMYKSVDSDGFGAQGGSYGADVDLSGVAFGTDTVNGNMRFGAVFNIGSGDTEGKGLGNGLKDEFDYYGFGIYSAMGFGNFALVGDASMTVISHEVEGLGLKGKADTTAVTMGLTGQYTVATPMVDVTPHLGARFIRLNTDSYDLVSADGVLATTDFDVQNVFSVPLGVTLSKAFVAGGWNLAPSADLTIAFNTGDTEAKSSNQFTGIKAYEYSTEVLDEVQYGLTVGLGAQYGAFGTSFGINYTGSENTDAFGVNAQARYMF